METNTKQSKKFWKPPSFEDFNILVPTKKIKLDSKDIHKDELTHLIPNEVLEPRTIDELATHPKKIEEVRNWMRQSHYQKAAILLVTGPTGSGKTTTIKVLADAEGFTVKEWINPVDKTDYQESDQYEKFTFSESKQTEKFEEFIFRSSRYNSLFEDSNNVLLLVEDIPNIYVWKPKLFHDFLDKFKLIGKSPIVFLITDDQSLNLHNNLFPNNIKNKLSVTNIKFNPVNHSSLIRNLKSLSDHYCSENVSSQFLENISKNSNGDLRNATKDLLLFLRTNVHKPSEVISKPKNKFKKGTSGLGENNKPLSEKDTSFDFYQILGRILYPKLMSEKEKMDCENQNRKFLHDVQKISECWTSSCLNILHENYLATFGKLADVVGGSDCFSICDVLGNHQELEQYTSLIGVIGLMSSNSQPKKTGFNPLKKSTWINKTSSNVEKGLSGGDFVLDLKPFLSILESHQLMSSQGKEEECSKSDEEEIVIEEYED